VGRDVPLGSFINKDIRSSDVHLRLSAVCRERSITKSTGCGSSRVATKVHRRLSLSDVTSPLNNSSVSPSLSYKDDGGLFTDLKVKYVEIAAV